MGLLGVIAASYGAIALLSWRAIGRWLTRHDPLYGWGDVGLCVFLATVVALTWGFWIFPALFYYAAGRNHGRGAQMLFGESRETKRSRQAQRIRELEKELKLQ